jgi:hypothetical protein
LSDATCEAVQPPRRNERLAGRFGGRDPLEHDRLVCGRRDHAEPIGCKFLDALGGAKCFDFETQVAVDVVFRCVLPLHLLQPIAVPEELKVLPRREHQHEHEHQHDAD